MLFVHCVCWVGLVVKNGKVQTRRNGTTQTIQAHFEPQIERDVQAYYDRFYNLSLHNFTVEDVSFQQPDSERFVNHACGKPYLLCSRTRIR